MSDDAAERDMLFTEFCREVLALQLTLGQYVLARVAFDGVNPGDLPDTLLTHYPDGRPTAREVSERSLALEMFGILFELTAEERALLILVVLRCGRGSGKSTLCAAFGIYAMCTGDVSPCGPGDMAAVVVVSRRLGEGNLASGGSSREVLRKALALVGANDYLRSRLRNVTQGGFSLERPDGVVVSFVSAPKSAGGVAVRSISILALIIDEAEFIGASASGTAEITDGAIIEAALPRVLPGAKLLLASTPWPAETATSAAFDANFGTPRHALAARAPTLEMRDYHPQRVAVREAMLATPGGDVTVARELDVVVTDVGGLYFESATIDAALRLPGAMPAPTRVRVSAAMDLAFRGDSSGLLVGERQGAYLVVTHSELRTPTRREPLSPSGVVGDFSAKVRELGGDHVLADNHHIRAARLAAAEHNLPVMEAPSQGATREAAFGYLRGLFRDRRVLFTDDRLRKQLKSVACKAQPGGGMAILLPRVDGSGHCDLVPCLVALAWADRRFGAFPALGAASAASSSPAPGAGGLGGIRTRHTWG